MKLDTIGKLDEDENFLVVFYKAAEEACSGMCNLCSISEVALGPRKLTAGSRTFQMHTNL